MHKKLQVAGLSILLIVITIFLAGCLDKNNNGGQETIPQLYSVGPLLAGWEDWDNDDIDDGIRVGFYFRDQSDNIIAFEDVEVFVTAELYTQVNTTPIQGEKDRLVYSNTFTITSSQDTHPIHGTALRIPAGDINVDSGTDYYLGILEVSVSVPRQGEFNLPPDNYIRLYDYK
jgi:hypothetical protein